MVATTNLPGSKYFNYFIGTRKECEEWLDCKADEFKKMDQGLWYACYSPAKITSNKEAAKWKYRDGTKVINFDRR